MAANYEMQSKAIPYDEACFDAMFAGVRLSSLVNSPHHTVHHLPSYLAADSSSSTFPETYPFFSEHFPALSETYSGDLKMPKPELPSEGGFDQFQSVPNLSDFHQLPNLHSLEDSQPNQISIGESSSPMFLKRVRTEALPASDYTLDAIVRSFKPRSLTPVSESQLMLARKRRAKMGERAKCLQNFMPWEKKLTMSNLLEQAFKYIKFLQAQISALESMPYHSSFNIQNQISNPRNGGQSIPCASSYLGRQSGQSMASESRYLGLIANPSNELWTLNRQELLGILVNSKVAQNMMYSQECCVYSIEQLILLKKIGQRRFLMQQQQQLMFGFSRID